MVLQVGLSRFLGEAQRLRVFGVAGGPVADEPLPLPTFVIATMMMPTMMMTIVIMPTSECPRGDQGGNGGASKELKRPTTADRSLGHCAGQIVEGAVATTSVVFFRHRVPPSHRRAELPSSCPATLFGDPATSQS
jgi:hypothetical protein